MREAFERRGTTMHRMLNDDPRRHVPRAAGRVLLLPEPQRRCSAATSRGARRTTHARAGRPRARSRPRWRSCPARRSARPGYARFSFALGDDDLVEGIRRIARFVPRPSCLSRVSGRAGFRPPGPPPFSAAADHSRWMLQPVRQATGADDGVELGVGEREHREPVAPGSNRRRGELGIAFNSSRGTKRSLHRRHGHPVPRGSSGSDAGRSSAMPGRTASGRARPADDLAHPGRTRRLGVRVVEDRPVADLHLRAGSCGPGSCAAVPPLAPDPDEIVVAEQFGLGLEQPVRHGPSVDSGRPPHGVAGGEDR